MIQANELRIGNWVEDIKPYDGQYFQVKFHHIGRAEHGERAYRPIQITESILLSCGFEKEGTTTLAIDGFPIFFKVMDDHKPQCFCFGINGVIPTPVAYVHELQNIYYFHTRKELECKL